MKSPHKGLLYDALEGLQRRALDAYRHQVAGCSPSALKPQHAFRDNHQLLSQFKAPSGQGGAIDALTFHPLDLAGMVFEHLLEDDVIPSAIKALLSYLHVPYLKVAYLDRKLFESPDHPARALLNQLSEASILWVDIHGNSAYAITELVQDMVGRILEEFTDDTSVFGGFLDELTSHVQKISHSHNAVEGRALEKIQGEEQLLEVKLRINQEVHQRIDDLALPAAVLLLLLQPWSDYMAFVLLRYSETSDAWNKVLQTTDDVLWSIKPKDNPAERAFQQDLHTDLLERLSEGLQSIGYDSDKGQKLLDALVALQRVALMGQQVAPAPASMRQKLEFLAAKKAWRRPEDSEHPGPEEAQALAEISQLGTGSWIELSTGKRMKVAFFNEKTQHYILVDQNGKSVVIKPALELARSIVTGKTKILLYNGQPYVDCILNRIFASSHLIRLGLTNQVAVAHE